jgi:alkanesulfonate monooxygenase SsuD/methylene tetrahydromethanopterin reductase-like flavin-dependent oxidoreductase (luciferase family)
MNFSLKLSPKVEPVLWGAAGGAAALAFVGFMFGGWVTGGRAAEMVRQQSEKAVIAVLAPICVDKFRHAKNVGENLGRLNAISYSWEKGNYVKQGGWATLPGNDEPTSGVAQACAELLSNLAK